MSAAETLAARQAPVLIDRAAAAALLNISIRHLDSLIKAKRVPHTRLGARVLLSPDLLAEWARAQMQVATA